MSAPRTATYSAGFWGHGTGYVPQSKLTSLAAAQASAQGWARNVRNAPFWVGAYRAEPDGEVFYVDENGTSVLPRDVPK